MNEEKNVTSRLREKFPEFAKGYEEGSYAFQAGEILRSFREKSGDTQVKLGRKLGLSQPRVAKAESGGGPYGPTYSYMKTVAKACNVTWPAKEDIISVGEKKFEKELAVLPPLKRVEADNAQSRERAAACAEAINTLRKYIAKDPGFARDLVRHLFPDPSFWATVMFQKLVASQSRVRIEPTIEGYFCALRGKAEIKKVERDIDASLELGFASVRLVRVCDKLDHRKSIAKRLYEDANLALNLSDPRRQLLLMEKFEQ